LITSHARGRPVPPKLAAWKIYETSIGASQHIALTDGSSVQLNTSTKLRTFIADPYRAVTLERARRSSVWLEIPFT